MALHGSGLGRQRNLSERFVDAFASVLLLPQQGSPVPLRLSGRCFNVTSGEIGDIELLYLARFFGVSFDVAVRRWSNLISSRKAGQPP